MLKSQLSQLEAKIETKKDEIGKANKIIEKFEAHGLEIK